MRNFFFLPLLSLALCFTACGSDSDAADLPDDNAAPTVEKSAVSVAFKPAAESLANGGTPAQVGGMLMQKFDAVSDATSGVLNQAESREFVRIATEMANKFPQDTLAALPLYRAAEVVRALNDPKRAAAIYEQVHTSYPTFSKAPEALFMLGFTYDEDLGNLEAAKSTYEKFLKMYPDNVFAEATPMLIENLGKSDEEILQQLERKQQ